MYLQLHTTFKHVPGSHTQSIQSAVSSQSSNHKYHLLAEARAHTKKAWYTCIYEPLSIKHINKKPLRKNVNVNTENIAY